MQETGQLELMLTFRLLSEQYLRALRCEFAVDSYIP